MILGGGDGEGWGLLLFHPCQEKGLPTSPVMVGGNAGESRQKLSFWDCHAWTVALPVREPYVEDNALQSLVVLATAEVSCCRGGSIRGLTGSGLAQK